MPKKHQNAKRPIPKKSRAASTSSALLAAVSLLGASLGVSVTAGSDQAEAKPAATGQHIKKAQLTVRKSGGDQGLQSTQKKSSLQSNQYKSPAQGSRRK
ncbi:MAG TPA: hypothetical protein VH558_04615 [Pseudolabrys sp.]